MEDLRELVVLITGAGSGIGNALARRFRADGASVVGCDLEPSLSAAEEACDLAQVCDVTDPEAVSRLVSTTTERFERLDVLIANAGIGRGGKLADVAWHDIEDVVQVNLFGVMHCFRAALPVMRRQGRGRLIALASRNAEFCPPGLTGYNVSKAGVVALTRTLAHELGDEDILVNNLIPGPTQTPLFPIGDREPDACYPTARMLATLPAGGPTGRTFFDLEDYPVYSRFSE